MSTRRLRTSAAIAAIAAAAGLIGVPAPAAAAVPPAAAAGGSGGSHRLHPPPTTPASTAKIAPPQRSGALRITGVARDGSVVRAAGLAWRPGRLPKGDRLLSFGVAYYWKSCAGGCRNASDSTATPFGASRYIVGHADTGRKLQLTETATEVVETDPATFSFSVFNASATVTSRRVAAAYPAGRAPRTEFVCHRRPGHDCWLPPHLNSAGKPLRWDWQIGRVTPLERTGKHAVDLYDIEGFLTTKAQ